MDKVIQYQEANKAVNILFFYLADMDNMPVEMMNEIDMADDYFEAVGNIPPYDFSQMEYKRVLRHLDAVKRHLERMLGAVSNDIWDKDELGGAFQLCQSAIKETLEAQAA